MTGLDVSKIAEQDVTVQGIVDSGSRDHALAYPSKLSSRDRIEQGWRLHRRLFSRSRRAVDHYHSHYARDYLYLQQHKG